MRAALPAAALAALWLLMGCASLQRGCADRPWLLCGDRVTVRRPHVYLDDPAFLYRNKAVARSAAGLYAFELPLFFNPHRAAGTRMTAALLAPGSAPAECRVAAGSRAAAPAGFAALDTAYVPAATARKEKVILRFFCRDYAPRWGREDTLALRFAPAAAAADSAADSGAAVLALPFTTGFRGPVYSFLAGSLLLVALTTGGEILAAGE